MKHSLFSFVLLFIFSCNTDDTDELDCSNVLCAGRPTIFLEVFDEDNSEQYFLGPDDQAPEGLIITNGNGTVLEFGLDYGTLDGRLSIFQLPDSFTMSLENEFETTISSDVSIVDSDGCCDTFTIGEVTTTQGALDPILDEVLVFRLTI
jgi:hypothetical protein